MAQYVRRDIWGLTEQDPWHPIIKAYALGVGELQKPGRPDALTWAYQAAIHATSQPPPAGEQFLDKCQHFCWFFLPWHRLYLYYFERIVRAAIEGLDEVDAETKAEWALPYWNYERPAADADHNPRSLPPAFIQPTLPGTTTANPLFVTQRKQVRNEGVPLDPTDTATHDALLPRVFTAERPVGGFGSAPVGPNHGQETLGRFPGPLERVPHGSVHVQVGGTVEEGDPENGYMSLFETAGLDPIFWLHHSNIDRLWEVWLGMEEGRANPPEGSSWRTQEFHFHDETGAAVTDPVAKAVDAAGSLGYTYEDTSPPPPPLVGRVRPALAPMANETPAGPPEFVGGTPRPVTLTGGEEKVGFGVEAPVGPAAADAGAPPQQVYLVFEGITGEQPGITYAVYLNLPDGPDDDPDPDAHYVGNLQFFGIERAGDVDSDRGSHGLASSFDITGLVRELEAEGRWDPSAIDVTLAPVHTHGDAVRRRLTGEGPDPAATDTPGVEIGRIGLYYA